MPRNSSSRLSLRPADSATNKTGLSQLCTNTPNLALGSCSLTCSWEGAGFFAPQSCVDAQWFRLLQSFAAEYADSLLTLLYWLWGVNRVRLAPVWGVPHYGDAVHDVAPVVPRSVQWLRHRPKREKLTFSGVDNHKGLPSDRKIMEVSILLLLEPGHC